MNKNREMLQEAQKELTEYVISQLNAGLSWSKCWNTAYGLPKSITSGKAYKGMNILWLLYTQQKNGYQSSEWGTFQSWKQAGGRVMKGEKGTSIIFFKPCVKENSEGEAQVFFTLKRYVVFNRAQIQGLEEANQAVEGIACDSGILFKYTEDQNIEVRFNDSMNPCYSPSADRISLPSAFTDESGGWSTVAHEIIHSTGHKSRLNREGVAEMKQGDLHQYSYEELVAELGSLFLCTELGLSTEDSKEQSAAYLASWAKVLKSNPDYLWKAAAESSKAVEFVQSIINQSMKAA